MFNDRRKVVFKRIMSLLAAVVLAVFAAPSYSSQEANYDLLIQRSPISGGVVTPGDGAHRAEANEVMQLAAIPNPGYKFVCWFGEVSDTSTNSTTIFVDSPKLVVAVFERLGSDFEFAVGGSSTDSGGGGGSSRLVRSSSFRSGSYSSPASSPIPPRTPSVVPVTPVPEPITAVLLGGGFLIMSMKRKRAEALSLTSNSTNRC